MPVTPRGRGSFTGYAMVAAAAALYGTNGTVSKVLIAGGLSPQQFAAVRSAGAAVFFVAASLLLRPTSLRFGRAELPWLVAFGVLALALIQWFYFAGLERLDVGVTLVIEYTGPVLVALWARFVVKDPVRRHFWLAIALALAGLTFVVDLWGGVRLDGIGVAASFAGAVTFALYLLLAERAVAHGRDVLSLLALGFVFATLFWTIVEPWWHLPGDVFVADVSLLGRIADVQIPFWSMLAVTLVLGTFVPFLLMLGALRHLPAAQVGVLGMLEPVVGAVVAFAWLGEQLGSLQILGGVVVLVGVALAQTAMQRTVRPARATASVSVKNRPDGLLEQE